MNQLDRKKITLMLALLFLGSCQNKANQITESTLVSPESKKTREENVCEISIDLKDLKVFYSRMLNSCKKGEDFSAFLSSNVIKKYNSTFCKLVIQSNSEKDAEIEYEVIQEEKECIGLINVNSINYYEQKGEKIKNEYSTYFLVKKGNQNALKIVEIGGAG